MKLFIFFVSSLIGLSSAAPQHLEDGVYMFEGMINKTIQSILASLPESIEVVPSLIDLSITDAALNGTLKVQNLTASGLKEMKVPKLHLAPFSMQLNITVEFDLLITADHYEDLVLIDLLPVYGGGPINIELGVAITLSTQLLNVTFTDGIKIQQVKNLRIQIGLESAHLDIRGLYYDDDFSDEISKLLDDKFANIVNIINSSSERITSVLSPIIEDLINGLLAGNSTLKEAFMQANLLPEEEMYNDYS